MKKYPACLTISAKYERNMIGAIILELVTVFAAGTVWGAFFAAAVAVYLLIIKIFFGRKTMR